MLHFPALFVVLDANSEPVEISWRGPFSCLSVCLQASERVCSAGFVVGVLHESTLWVLQLCVDLNESPKIVHLLVSVE